MPPIPRTEDPKKTLLTVLRRRKELSLPDAIAHVAAKRSIPMTATRKMLGCGKETALQNRVRWARWEFQQEGRVRTTRRGHFARA